MKFSVFGKKNLKNTLALFSSYFNILFHSSSFLNFEHAYSLVFFPDSSLISLVYHVCFCLKNYNFTAHTYPLYIYLPFSVL